MNNLRIDLINKFKEPKTYIMTVMNVVSKCSNQYMSLENRVITGNPTEELAGLKIILGNNKVDISFTSPDNQINEISFTDVDGDVQMTINDQTIYGSVKNNYATTILFSKGDDTDDDNNIEIMSYNKDHVHVKFKGRHLECDKYSAKAYQKQIYLNFSCLKSQLDYRLRKYFLHFV